MDASKQPSPEFRETDADVSLLLYKTGRALKQFFLWIGAILAQLGAFILSILVFLFRNILWLIAGAVLGLAWGYYNYSKEGPHFTSLMTVKANFNSSRSLYNTVEYLNSLIAANKSEELGKIFSISASQSDALVQFSVAPIESELITAEMYKNQYMEFDPRPNRVQHDTMWLRTMTYETFKSSLTKFDYPYYEIKLDSRDASIFPKLEKGFVNQVSQSQVLQSVRTQQVASNIEEEKLLLRAIGNIDTLREAYNQRLAKGEQTSVSPGNQLTLLQANPTVSSPELQLYDKMLELLDQLKKSRKRTSTEKEVIEILSPFNPVGRKLTFLKQNGTEDIIIGLALAAGVLILLTIYKKLVQLDKKARTKHIV